MPGKIFVRLSISGRRSRVSVPCLPRTSPRTRRHHGNHPRFVRRGHTWRDGPDRRRTLRCLTRARQQQRGDVSHSGPRPRAVPRGDRPRRIRDTAARDRARRRADAHRRHHADALARHRSGGRDRAAPGGSRPGSADSRVGRRRPSGRRHGRLQREPAEGTDSHRPVLFDQPAQFVGADSRAGRAVRPDQRRHRARRRAVRRRRLLRAAGSGHARLPRRRTNRSAARTAGHALRQEHDGRRDQRDDAETDVHARSELRAQLRQSRIRAGERRRSRAALFPKVAGRLSFSGTQRDGHALQHRDPQRPERPQQSGPARSAALHPVRSRRHHARRRLHATASRRLHAGRRRRRPHAAPGQPAVPADCGGSRLHPSELQRVRSADRRRHADALVPGSRWRSR